MSRIRTFALAIASIMAAASALTFVQWGNAQADSLTPGSSKDAAHGFDRVILDNITPGIPSPPTGSLFLPTLNHSHVVDNSRVNAKAIWWEVRPVLVMDPQDWPAADGSSGITSSRAMDAAEAAGRAVEVGSNFFLFFSSKATAKNGIEELSRMQ